MTKKEIQIIFLQKSPEEDSLRFEYLQTRVHIVIGNPLLSKRIEFIRQQPVIVKDVMKLAHSWLYRSKYCSDFICRPDDYLAELLVLYAYQTTAEKTLPNIFFTFLALCRYPEKWKISFGETNAVPAHWYVMDPTDPDKNVASNQICLEHLSNHAREAMVVMDM